MRDLLETSAASHLDDLTHLPNRALLRQQLEAAVARTHQSGQPMALLIMDLDRFKEVNDTLGHHVGDVLLQQIGQRLLAAVRHADLVARLGGDEFAILLPDTNAAGATSVARSMVDVLRAPFVLAGQPIDVDASFGIAVAPEHGQDADTLLRYADVAMYQAKRSGTGVALYCAADDQNSPDRLALLGDLRSAIDNDELLLHYQPKLDLRDGTLVGVEALVRWQHPQQGFLPPSEFIQLAEQTGLIHPLSRWVLAAALKQHCLWRGMGLEIPVAINLSRRTLHDAQLPDMVADLLARWDVPPDALVLEITESSLMADPVRAGQNLNELRALGVRISIDDFGTGYSSLASLKNLPVDELKIDQSFVQEMATDASSRAIVRSIIDLADALKLRVVAEGVEDRATWDVLAGLGCAVAQGYFLSRPMPATDMEAWLALAGPSWLAVAERSQAHDALQERISGRGARLIAEEEFVARKHAEAALLASEERNRLALQAAGMGTWDFEVSTDRQLWSTETQALHGLEQGTFDGTFSAFKGAIHPDDWPAFEIEMQAAQDERRDSFAIYRTIWPDGSIHWLENKSRALYAADGTLLRVTGTSMDITERKRTEAALHASEERNRLALQAARMGTFDRGPLLDDLLTWSPEMEALHGVAPGTFEGTLAALQRRVHPEDWPAFEIEIKASEAEHRETDTIYRAVWPDGSEHWLEVKGRGQYAEDGTLMRVSGTSMDVTERKQAEEALRASEERFRRQYKGGPLPTYSWLQQGDDFVMLDFNDAAEALGEDNISQCIGVLASVHYAGQADLLSDLHACVTEQHTIRRELRFRNPTSGRERDLAVSYVFVPPSTVMLHTDDITERKQAEQQREAMAQSEKLRALGQMASGIAHDLNQSLMLVASYSELARRALHTDPLNLVELDDLLTTATQGAMDGGETVKRLLQFTRDAPQQDTGLVDLTGVVRDAARLTAPRWRDTPQGEGRPISLHIDAADHPSVRGSSSRLRELMTNLVFNAVDALPTGGTIHLRVSRANDQGIIEVSDSGVGMSLEVQKRIFEPFFTTRGEHGMGLGLAMVFGIVEQHSGQIEVHSTPGEGTTFRIVLPLAEELARDEAAAPVTAGNEPVGPLRVLIIDDEPMMTRAAMRMLKPTSHLVTLAGSGEEALAALAERPFDVVVSDVGMGAGMNGWELADVIRRSWPEVRFLLATGWGAAIDPAKARERGVEAILAKPYSAEELTRALAGVGTTDPQAGHATRRSA